MAKLTMKEKNQVVGAADLTHKFSTTVKDMVQSKSVPAFTNVFDLFLNKVDDLKTFDIQEVKTKIAQLQTLISNSTVFREFDKENLKHEVSHLLNYVQAVEQVQKASTPSDKLSVAQKIFPELTKNTSPLFAVRFGVNNNILKQDQIGAFLYKNYKGKMAELGNLFYGPGNHIYIRDFINEVQFKGNGPLQVLKSVFSVLPLKDQKLDFLLSEMREVYLKQKENDPLRANAFYHLAHEIINLQQGFQSRTNNPDFNTWLTILKTKWNDYPTTMPLNEFKKDSELKSIYDEVKSSPIKIFRV